MRLLFVDDDLFGLQSYREHLQIHLECEIVTARTVGDAQEILSNDSNFDLVILDVHLPMGFVEARDEDKVEDEMKYGQTLLNIMNKRWPNIPVIVFSITNSDNLKDQYKQVKRVLRKQNVLPSELTEKIRNAETRGTWKE